jgi:pimeloyl-ACP methyl ester carboxylesterase
MHEVVDTGECRWFARISLPPGVEGPPVVFLHGVVVSGAYFWPVATRLAGEFPLYVPDAPGTGHSTLRLGSWSIEAQAARLAAWLDLHGLCRCVLVGNSLGSQVLTMLAQRRPDLAGALVLVSPTTDPEVDSVVHMMWRGLRDIPREHIGLWRIWLPDLVRTGPLRGLQQLRSGLDDTQVERLGTLTMPVIAVGGEHDPIAPQDWIATIAEEAEQGREVIVPGAPHALHYANPASLARVIRTVAARCGD